MVEKKRALITGVDGQDGSYLAEWLLGKGYEVFGMVRRVALEDPARHLWRIRGIKDRLTLLPGTLESYASIVQVVQKARPDECYHLAAQSFVALSFEDAFSTLNTNVAGTHYVLAAVKEFAPECRVYFAASSEMFGLVQETPQRETTRFHPRSPYGISKVAGFDLTRNFREAYGMFACSGILFNHESPRRGEEFVTRKISQAAARIKVGLQDNLALGNLEAKRDWGFAGDYVEAMWRMLQQRRPDDYVVATGRTHTVGEFCQEAFGYLGMDWKKYVVADRALMRPSDVQLLKGDASKARRVLGWRPRVGFRELVRMMVDADVDRLRKMEWVGYLKSRGLHASASEREWRGIGLCEAR